MQLLKLRLRGPMSLLDDGERGNLFAHPDASRPGIYLWTFLHNHCDRINKVGSAETSVALAHADHVAAFLRGEYGFHSAAEREEGTLRYVYQPQDGVEAYRAEVSNLFAELHQLRVFFAPVSVDGTLRSRIAVAIENHIVTLGGKARDWLDTTRVVRSPPADVDESISVQFYRPVLMASMPDEISV